MPESKASLQRSPKEGDRPEWELADIARLYGREYERSHALTPSQRKALWCIERCRTAELGGYLRLCAECGYREQAYLSCGNRNCPKCQGRQQYEWITARQQELLPIPYYHIVFTLPDLLNELTLLNPQTLYPLLTRTAAETLLTFGRDPRWLGAEIGCYGVLHTWGQTLVLHPHVHFLVTGGGLRADGAWVSAPKGRKFLFPIGGLAQVFRGKFMAGLKKLYRQQVLTLPVGSMASSGKLGWERFLDDVVNRRWVVYAKSPLKSAAKVVEYLGRYLHRVAISNRRLVSVEQGQVTFRYRDYRDGGKEKLLTLSANDFLRRFLLHVLPEGLHRVRYYGLFANGKRAANLERSRIALAQVAVAEAVADREAQAPLSVAPKLYPCPDCGQIRWKTLDLFGRSWRSRLNTS